MPDRQVPLHHPVRCPAPPTACVNPRSRRLLARLPFTTMLAAIVLVTKTFWAASGALAAEADTDALPWKTWEFTLGGYLTTHDASLRVDSDTLGRGTEIDMEDDLGFDKTLETVRFDATWRFLPRHRASFSVYQFSRDASRTLNRTIQYGDRVFVIDATVASEFDMTVYKASYAYSVIQNAEFDLGLSAGLHLMDMKSSIAVTGLGVSESAELLAPLPVLGLRGAWAITPTVFLKANLDVFAISIDDTRGRFTDALVALEYNAFEHFGVGIGYNRVYMNIKADGDKFDGEAGAGFGAVMVYGKLFF